MHEYRVLLFTDVVGSVALRRRVGDLRYEQEIKGAHDALFHAAIGPDVLGVEDTGDGFLASFRSVPEAVAGALRFQQALRNRSWSAEAPAVRTAIHAGEVLVAASRRVKGGPVEICSRVMDLAAGGQILLTRHVFDDARQYVREHPAAPGASQPPPLRWLAHGPYRFKGIDDDPLEVFEVGAAGLAPFRPPPDSGKGRRVVGPDEEAMLGWRPAAEQEIPGRAGWILVRKLGEGGFGEVWLARQPRTGDARVMKFCFDADRLRSFRREMTLFLLLRDELGDRRDIARLLEVQLEKSPYLLESELTPEGDLRAWSDRQGGIGLVPLATRLEFVARTADAVAAAHRVGVLHKDLKPANILVYFDEEGVPRPRISDFGIGILTDRTLLERLGLKGSGFTATQLTENESSRTGTRLYAPPEALSGMPFTTLGDIYALGVLLFQMVVGDLDRPMAVGWERALEPAIPDPDLRGLLRDDLAAMVDVDPERRPGSAAAVAEGIRTLEERREGRLREHAAATALARRRRVRRRVVAGGTFLVLALAVAGLFLGRERALRAEAEREREAAQELALFMLNDLVPRARELGRLDILEAAARKAAAFYTRTPLESAPPETLRDRAFALVQVGSVLEAQGDDRAALETFASARRVIHQYLAFAPTSIRGKGVLVQVLMATGRAHAMLGWTEQALAPFFAALDAAREISGAVPNASPYERMVGLASVEAAGMLLALGRHDEAASLLQSGVEILGRLAETGEPTAVSEGGYARAERGRLQIASGHLAAALEDLRAAVDAGQRALAAAPGSAPLKADLLLYREGLGDALSRSGDAEGARAQYAAHLELAERLLEASAGHPGHRRARALARQRLARIAMEQGEQERALALLEAAGAELEELVAAHPRNLNAVSSLATNHDRIGMTHLAQRRFLDARRRFEAALALEAILQEYRPRGVSHRRAVCIAHLGEVALNLDEKEEALQRFRESLAMTEGHADRDSRDNAAVCHERIGCVQKSSADLSGALESFRHCLALRESLATDPDDGQAQEALASARTNLGDVLRARGELDSALELYLAAHAVRTRRNEPLALSIAEERLGLLHRARRDLPAALPYFERSLARIREFAAAGPKEIARLDALEISLKQVAGVLLDLGETERALPLYEEAVATMRRILVDVPEDRPMLLRLAIALDRLRNVQAARDHHTEALAAAREALDVVARVCALAPEDRVAHFNLARGHQAVGETAEDAGEFAAALGGYREALSIARGLGGESASTILGEIGDRERGLALLLGESQPESATDHGILGDTLHRAGLYLRAVAAFREALRDEAVRADLDASPLYNGACAASRASAATQGEEADALRREALAWLAEDLRRRRERAAADPGAQDEALAAHLAHARVGDPDLAPLRDLPEFARLFE
ncbi:MAG: tetratricopeptide repeat protein [Planctomycetaceae bacterium]